MIVARDLKEMIIPRIPAEKGPNKHKILCANCAIVQFALTHNCLSSILPLPKSKFLSIKIRKIILDEVKVRKEAKILKK
jgi:hypothetical protein